MSQTARSSNDGLKSEALYDGIRFLYRHTRQATHYSVMELTPLQSVMGGVGLKKRHRSARSLVTLEKRHRSARSLVTLEKRHRVLARSQALNFHNNVMT